MNSRANLRPEKNRLPSFAQPRDLKLNSTKLKKLYTPNINAVRNKGGPVPTLSSDGNRKGPRKSKDFKKNGQNKTERFIQSSGIFSEGIGEGKKHASSSYADRSESSYDPTYTMEKPRLDTHASWNVNEKEETQVISQLLNEGQVLERPDDMGYQPVTLPLARNNECFFKRFAPAVQSDLPSIKTETISDDEGPKTETLKDIFSSMNTSENGLILVQLPDSMPGCGYNEEGKPIDYTLDNMPEGRVGRLVRRQSGRIEVLFGPTAYTFDKFEKSDFAEDVVCCPDPEGKCKTSEPTMAKLGPVAGKFVIAPSWDSLLQKDEGNC